MKRILLVTTALVAAAEPAQAGPVAAAVAWVGSTLAAGGIMAAVVQTVIGLGLSLLASALMPKPDMPGIDVNFTVEMADDAPLSFVVGDYATAGKRKYIGSWGKNTRFITEVIEYSALPQGLSGLWVNDERGEFLAGQRGSVSASASPQGVSAITNAASVPGGNLDVGQPLANMRDTVDTTDPRIWVKFVDGTQTGADPLLVWVFGADPDYPWTAAAVGLGKSYAIVTTQYDDDTLTSYPQYLFEPEPLALYDLRFDSTNGGSGAQRWGDPATWAPTRNPAVIAYNIIRGIYFGSEWVYGGKNLSAWRLPSAEWIAAANECDDPVSLAGGGTEPRYRCGAEIRVDVEPANALEEIGKAANMRFPEVGGRVKAIVGLPGTASLGVTDGDIIITEGQSFSPFYPVGETYNAISATHPEPGEKWASKDAPEYIDEDATAEDGGRYLPTSISYPAAPHARQVQRLMRAQMRDFRRMRRHQFFLPPDAYGLEPGVDVVSWTSERNGYVNKWFMVESVRKAPGMNVLVSLREVDPGDYDWSSGFEMPVVITPPKNPVPFMQPINGLTAIPALVLDADGVGRRPAIQVSCDGDETGVTNIQIQARVQGRVTTIDTTRRFGNPYSWYLINVLPITIYEVRARLLSDLTPKSEWSSWLSVTTPDTKLGPLDLEMDAIQEEVTADLADLEAWADDTGDYIRRIREEIAAVRDFQADLDAGALLARNQIRRELSAEVGNAKATFAEQIDVIISDQFSAALQIETLTARLAGTTALLTNERLTRASADSALAAEITALETALDGKASSSAVTALTSRVDDVEGDLSAQSSAITTTQAQVGRLRANGLLRVFSTAAPSGSQTRIGLSAEAADGEATHSAAMFLEAKSDGTSHIIAAADRFAIATGNGTAADRRVPFVVDGGLVYMDEAFIRVGRIGTLLLDGNAVTVPATQTIGTTIAGEGDWTLNANVVTFTMPYAGVGFISWFGAQSYLSLGGQAVGIRLRINGATSWERLTGSPPGSGGINTDWLSMGWSRNFAAGTHTIRVDWWGGNSNLTLITRTLTVQAAMR